MEIVEKKSGHNERLSRLGVKLSNPLSLCWQVTKRCNYHCPFCLSGEQDSYELPLEKMKKIIDILEEENLIRIDFTGGEPLLRSDFLDILSYAAGKGIETLVTSNGSIWSEEIAKTLLDTNTLLLISLDGNAETHDKSRGQGSWARAVENIKRYTTAGVPIRVNYLIRRDNLNQIDYIYDLVKSLGVERLFYILIAPQGKAYQNEDLLLTDEERKYYLNLIQKKKAQSGDEPFITIQDYATNLHSCFLIDSRGDIVSQGYTEDDCVVTGNIFTDGLQKCWNHPAFNHRGHFLQYAYMFEYYM